MIKERGTMEDTIKVTIVIPVYNVGDYIENGLASCINQTYSNIEIIVVDDGSTDSTASRIENQSSLDERIILLKQSNKGVSAARNNALRNATGDYVIFLDGDDWLEKNAVEVLINNLHKYENAFIICSRYIVDEEDKSIRINDDTREEIEFVSNESILESFLYKYFYFQSSCYKLFDLKIIKQNNILFSEDISHGEDGLFVFTYLQYASKVVSIPIPLWDILDRVNSASNASFNERKLTAIDAAEKMLTFDITNKVRDEIIRYLIIRAETMYLEACMDGVKSNIRALKIIKSKLKEYRVFLNFRDIAFKEKTRYLLFTYMPFGFMSFILKIKNRNR